MLQFPNSRNEWNLDVVSILAVLGESNIKLHRLNMTASNWCLLPRLMPAPQALLLEGRPKRLPLADGQVFGINSGNTREGINFLADVLLKSEYVEQYQTVAVTIVLDDQKAPTDLRRLTPLSALAIVSCGLSIGLVVWAIIIRDGVALIAVLIMSFASSVLGLLSKWSPEHHPVQRFVNVPADPIVIGLRNGAFIVVKCDTNTARQLFWSPEMCHYKWENKPAQAVGGVGGGAMILVAVVLFGNCSWTMQAAIGAVYALLNLVYWLFVLIPEERNWYLERWRVKKTFCNWESYTQAIWDTMRLSRSTRWVLEQRIVPDIDAWHKWVEEAQSVMEAGDKAEAQWDCRLALSRHFGKADGASRNTSTIPKRWDIPSDPDQHTLTRTVPLSHKPL